MMEGIIPYIKPELSDLETRSNDKYTNLTIFAPFSIQYFLLEQSNHSAGFRKAPAIFPTVHLLHLRAQETRTIKLHNFCLEKSICLESWIFLNKMQKLEGFEISCQLSCTY